MEIHWNGNGTCQQYSCMCIRVEVIALWLSESVLSLEVFQIVVKSEGGGGGEEREKLHMVELNLHSNWRA